MTTDNILSLFGGLALFLYGMHMMSEGLEEAAGDKMKQILEKLTSNRFLGIIVGALITAVIQSSSATTVMVVGFVNSGAAGCMDHHGGKHRDNHHRSIGCVKCIRYSANPCDTWRHHGDFHLQQESQQHR